MPRIAPPSRALPAALEPLRAATRWVLWKREPVKGRPTKVPYQRVGLKASSTNRKTWVPFDLLPPLRGFDGRGLVLGDGLHGVDMDACITADGELEPWAAAVVERLDSYTELSPSGRGLKVFMCGPPGDSAEVSFGEPVELQAGEWKRRELALYTGKRYFTVTGRAWLDKPLRTITDADAAWLRERIEALRERRRTPATTPKRLAAHQVQPDLHPELLALVRDGVPEGQDRSAQFHHAVRWAADSGMTAGQITALIEQYPEGIGAKYAGRVTGEVERSLRGYAPKLRQVRQRPASSPPAGGAPPSPPADIEGEPAPPPEFSEDHLALVFVQAHADRYRWSPGMGWMHDTGVVWERDDRLTRYDLARAVCRASAAQAAKPDEKKRLTSAKTVNAVLSLAQSDQRVVVPAAAWDGDPMLLNTPAGVVDLRTGMLRPRRPEDYPTQAARVAPDFANGAPLFDRFLLDIFDGDHDTVDFMQRALGYCMTGDRREQVLFFWHGSGANGKSTLLDLVQWLLNTYALKLPTAALMVTRNERHPTEMAQLRRKRLAISSELEDGQFWNEALIKELVGDGLLTARFMRQDFFEFEMTQKHIIVGNYKPRLRGGDPAIARRMVLVPFEVRFDGDRRDSTIGQKLRAEAPAILAWMVRGAVRWQREGLGIPERVRGASAEYLADHDDLVLWMDECCVRVGEARAGDLYASFKRWKERRGEHAPSMTAWGQRLQAVPGLSRRRSNGWRYAGIALTAAQLTGHNAYAEREE